MKPRTILASFAVALAACAQGQVAPAPARDDVLLEMREAFRAGNQARLAQLLPAARGHALEPWAAYWELRARLDTAAPEEVQAFFQRYAGTYQEDRLRNDWLRLLGQRRDWERFAEEYPRFRMQDDREVRCYALLVDYLRQGPATPQSVFDEVRQLWFGLRDPDDGCTHAASRMIGDSQGPRRLTEADAWHKARLAIEANRLRAASAALEIVAPQVLPQLQELHAGPARFLARRVAAPARVRRELAGLALIRLAASDPAAAAEQLEQRWSAQLPREERDWLWGVIGRQAAVRLQPEAHAYFARVERDEHLDDEHLAWKVRAALRAGPVPDWRAILRAVAAMSEPARKDPAWVYWKARALLATATGDGQRAEAQALLESIAGPGGFYEQLALEELGRKVEVPPPPAPLTPQERDGARRNIGLNRALYAILLGLRPEGVREWHYTIALHQPGGMSDRELLAAAQLACDYEIWDRCINTSKRARSAFHAAQRYPMPFRESVVRRAREIDLDPAYVYGLIRQESRFIMDARSTVGASGLMQIMPATARWTARRIGLTDFTPAQLNDRETNITIGTSYLKMVLDDFEGSLPLAAAAYNAGPGRPRAWRNGPVMEAAAWAESVPFTETREYVKKVLANTTFYAALLTGQPQSIKARLGIVGPRDASARVENRDLP